ncbi:MAG: hypothetical protein NT157_00520 [Candidatus Micrarchaeota archaeon]|nr:hypothetical protein [Candidatus Micrarchaeota archaeon]
MLELGGLQISENIILAILVFLLSPIAAEVAGWIVGWIFAGLRFQDWLKKHGLHDSILGISPVSFFVTMAKVLVFLVFIEQAALLLQASVITAYLQSFVVFMVGLVRALVLMAFVLIIADYMGDRIKAAGGIPASHGVALVIEVLVVYVGVVAALDELRINTTLLADAFRYFVLAFCVAIGLGLGIALGLGLKDTVSEVAKDNKKWLSDLAKYKK